jgi:hypothetical protein
MSDKSRFSRFIRFKSIEYKLDDRDSSLCIDKAGVLVEKPDSNMIELEFGDKITLLNKNYISWIELVSGRE